MLQRWVSFLFRSEQHSSSQARDLELQIFSNQIFPTCKLSLRSLAAFILLLLSRRHSSYWKHIPSQRDMFCPWMNVCNCQKRGVFFCKSFEFCIIILTKECFIFVLFCFVLFFVLFSVALSGLWQKKPTRPKNPKPKKPQQQPWPLFHLNLKT